MLTQYGFVRPENPYDVIDWDAIDIIDTIGVIDGVESLRTLPIADGDDLAEEVKEEENQLPCVSLTLVEKALAEKAKEDGVKWMRLRVSDNRLRAALASIPDTGSDFTGKGGGFSGKSTSVLTETIRREETRAAQVHEGPIEMSIE
jgi:hypothetical protein